jgi:RHS repeat-associated protein
LALTYDANGNRTSMTTPQGTEVGIYNERDQVQSYAGRSYAFDADGFLQTMTLDMTGATTSYDYDARGNLRTVALPDGNVIDYEIDAQNRRVGKRVNAVLQHRLLYEDGIAPIAQVDAQGRRTAQYVFAEGNRVPSYILMSDVATCVPGNECDFMVYRVLTDHLGSVRLVVDVATKSIAQRIDYDPFGRVLLDTNPGFQPFGFAGGLYDPDTGLVRFGARDYDAVTGRWTAKDPILFGGRAANLYAYVGNDPINYIDPSGLWAFGFSFEFSTINPWSSGGGGSYGINAEYTSDAGWNLYTYGTPNDQPSEGLLIGPSLQFNGALGNGDWAGPFRGATGGYGPICGGYFETANPSPSEPGYFGFSLGLGKGPPGVGRTTTNYSPW